MSEAASELSAKRKGGGVGIDGWYPYYAGFSYSFARQVLSAVCGERDAVVLDPWNGSGTTTAAAARLGHLAIGLDLNPATVVIARAKLATPADISNIYDDTRRCLEAARRGVESRVFRGPDALDEWLPPRAAAFTREAMAWLTRRDRVKDAVEMTPGSSLVALALLNGLRQAAVDHTRSNVTWTQPSVLGRKASLATLTARCLRQAARIKALGMDLKESQKTSFVGIGDARSLAIESESVDVVLSSPPYCTRIDYAKQTAFELAVMQTMGPSDARSLREQLMGTTTLRETKNDLDVALPAAVRKVLRAIADHPSHRSRAYYSRNFRQYFLDAALAIAEIARVLKSGGSAVLVLQNSFYKEIEIPLTQLFSEFARQFALSSVVVARRPVGRNMTLLNTRSRAYKQQRLYTEDVLLLRK